GRGVTKTVSTIRRLNQVQRITQMIENFDRYWGVDVSKEWLDISIENQAIRIPQTVKSLSDFLKKHKVNDDNTLVILESTGGYEKLAVNLFTSAGLIVHVAHPNKVAAFAKARGRLAKT